MSHEMTPLEIRLSLELKRQVTLNLNLVKSIENLKVELRKVLSPGAVRIPMTTLEHESERAVAERGQFSNRRIEGGQ